jgi:hypothetical protein
LLWKRSVTAVQPSINGESSCFQDKRELQEQKGALEKSAADLAARGQAQEEREGALAQRAVELTQREAELRVIELEIRAAEESTKRMMQQVHEEKVRADSSMAALEVRSNLFRFCHVSISSPIPSLHHSSMPSAFSFI